MIARRRPKKKGWSFPLIRDIILFVAGLAGLAYETIFTTIDRPTLLLLYAAMLGLPAFLQANNDRVADEKEISESLRRRRTLDSEDDEEDEDADRKEDLLAELKQIEDRERQRRTQRQDREEPPVRGLPRRDTDDDDGHDGHRKRRAR